MLQNKALHPTRSTIYICQTIFNCSLKSPDFLVFEVEIIKLTYRNIDGIKNITEQFNTDYAFFSKYLADKK